MPTSTEKPRDYYNPRDQEVSDNLPYAAIVKAVVEIIQRANFLGPVESNNGFTVNGVPLEGGGGSAHVIENEGTPLAARSNLNFVGAGVDATDAGGKTVVTIPGPTYPVTSVNGQTGSVSLNSDNIAEGATNLYNRTHTGDVTGATVLTIINDIINNARLANMVANTIKGRIGSDGDPQDLTAAQVRSIINVADGANAYSHPNHTGEVTSVGDGAQTLAATAITNRSAVTPAGADHVLIYDASGAALAKALISLWPITRPVATLIDAATIDINASLAVNGIFTVTLGGNRIFGAPTGSPANGQTMELWIKQDGTGSRTGTWNSIYKFNAVGGTPVLSTAASRLDFGCFQYVSADNVWACTTFLKGVNV